MLARYSLPEMEKIWTSQNKYQTWLYVEIAVCKALNKLGIIPNDDLQIILEKADFDTNKIDEIEKVTKHDVIAFLTNVAEYIGKPARWIHYGMTSSDMLDTATALLCKQAGDLLFQKMSSLCVALRKRALEHKNTICIGRTHGIHAEPTSFGLKFALWYDEMQRNIVRLKRSIETISVGKISGAVGNFAHLSPKIEELACAYLDLNPSKISTQIIQRDIHAEYISTIALIGSTIEKIALEIRHLQRTEVHEAEENFSKGQKGSSAMPHKKNPINCEQISGLARLLRANLQAALENNALWHERDISHSSVERVILPDSTILLHYMLEKMTILIDNLTVFPENIKRNLEMTHGLVFSQILLLKLAEKGCSREAAYDLVQKHALVCWEKKVSFKNLIKSDENLMKFLDNVDIDEIFNYSIYMNNVDFIFKRVGII